MQIKIEITEDQYNDMTKAKAIMEKKLQRGLTLEEVFQFLTFAYLVTYQKSPGASRILREIQGHSVAFNPSHN